MAGGLLVASLFVACACVFMAIGTSRELPGHQGGHQALPIAARIFEVKKNTIAMQALTIAAVSDSVRFHICNAVGLSTSCP
jgi:hypothetical protein